MKTHYTADQCHTGGYECSHQHRTAEAARRCLPTLPTQSSGSLTQTFSLATIHRYADGVEVEIAEND